MQRFISMLILFALSGCAGLGLTTSPKVDIVEEAQSGRWISQAKLPLELQHWRTLVPVRVELARYSGKNRAHVEDSFYSMSQNGTGAVAAFEVVGIPHELLALGIIESKFNPKARNRSGASGLWQFMPQTARAYGLRVGTFHDERYDPAASSLAAAKLLKDLYLKYQDWALVLAAYNAGSGYVDKQIKSGQTRDFWKLSELGLICKQTREFVPRVLAAALIVHEPELYGFSPVPDMLLEALNGSNRLKG